MPRIDKAKAAKIDAMAAKGYDQSHIAAVLSVSPALVRKRIEAAQMQRAGLISETRPEPPQDG